MKIVFENINLKRNQVVRKMRFQVFTAERINVMVFVQLCRWLLSPWKRLPPPSSGWNPEDHNLKVTRDFHSLTTLCDNKIIRYLSVIWMLQLVIKN
jgi:hypothetical protein